MTSTIRTLGQNITAARKAAGLTQSALAARLAVSTQAISRWENGGAPDAAILPELAAALNVSIDGLYGLRQMQSEDASSVLRRKMHSVGQEQKLEVLYQMVHELFKAAIESYNATGASFRDFMETNEGKRRDDPACETATVYFSTDQGVVLESMAPDMHYFFCMPEPPGGYPAAMKEKGEYLRLFRLLAKDHRLDMLLFLFGENRNGFTASRAALELGIDEALAEETLLELHEHNFLHLRRVSSAEGELNIYFPKDLLSIVPFLYFANELMVSRGTGWIFMNDRTKCLLDTPLGTGGFRTAWVTRSQYTGSVPDEVVSGNVDNLVPGPFV